MTNLGMTVSSLWLSRRRSMVVCFCSGCFRKIFSLMNAPACCIIPALFFVAALAVLFVSCEISDPTYSILRRNDSSFDGSYIETE